MAARRLRRADRDGTTGEAGFSARTRIAVLAAGALLLGTVALPASSADPRPDALVFTAAPADAVGSAPKSAPKSAPESAPKSAPDSAASCTPASANVSLTPSTDDSGVDVQRIIKRKKLIAGIDTNSYLWGFRNPANGELEGFDIDLVHALAKSILGNADAVEFLSVPTADRISALQSGEVDVVVRTMTIDCDREQQVAFSSPYFVAGQAVVAPLSSPIKGYDTSLKGKRVCAATGSTGIALLQRRSFGATVVPVENQLDCLVLMQLGTVDATVTDNALGAGQQAQDPTIHLVGTLMDRETYGVAMKLGEDDLVRRVNAVLDQFRADQWDSEYRTWLQAALGPSSGPPTVSYAG
ncbi:glutamate ABC transporter substrate-binding protein [Streptacidiphilus sp. P02-A3a]|uniref:glutamate ABC transporter substrate-binding protein n=1 Tax=Streptacidiphilus sp. P02-A3a TaxID=2704468 RepID=UPI0015FD4A52|nr:glutamate ABC transporter substrate-binding protein [Streptacidiphilus sp. P02-A3a]QMU68088.1 transporter substrate-binding domain-containing protein [Streptacidiphilus sp. P02-A3a]